MLLLLATAMAAQTAKWQDVYKVKKKDTVYGIAKKYGITVHELMTANPEISGEDFKLRKGDKLYIPFPTAQQKAKTGTTASKKQQTEKLTTVNVGIMLPLHDVDGDGRRMVEYYRGILMACDSLRRMGINTQINAWNVPIYADIRQTLLDENASRCDIIFGPLYTKQVPHLADFCKRNDIKMVIPFSISGDDVTTNANIFQVYRPAEQQYQDAVAAFVERFSGYHPVLIDCNDTTSRKGLFTSKLRRRLEEKGIQYNVTNLKSSESQFSKAFSRTQPNIVILNTARSPELNVALAKLDGLSVTDPTVQLSLFGYTEWLMYTSVYLNYFHKYDAYIPTLFYYNPLSASTADIERSYRRWFGTDMQKALPRFALTGYDHAQFFIKGMHDYGKTFKGTRAQSTYRPLQTPLSFVRTNAAGGMMNTTFMLIHYTRDHKTESISY